MEKLNLFSHVHSPAAGTSEYQGEVFQKAPAKIDGNKRAKSTLRMGGAGRDLRHKAVPTSSRVVQGRVFSGIYQDKMVQMRQGESPEAIIDIQTVTSEYATTARTKSHNFVMPLRSASVQGHYYIPNRRLTPAPFTSNRVGA